MFNFQGEGHVHLNCLFNILTNNNNEFFQFLSCGICIHIPVVTRFKMDASGAEKVVIFGRKNLF